MIGSGFPLPKGLIDASTFERESRWTTCEITTAILDGRLHPIRVGKCGLAFQVWDIPAASGSALLLEYLKEQVELKRTELAQAEARLRDFELAGGGL